jgi:GNAT superfamily N-acetyltransferase
MGGSDFSSLENSVWSSLSGEHKSLGIRSGGACRYFPDVSPFAAIKTKTVENLRDLAGIVSAGETVLIRGEIPEVGPEWTLEKHIHSLQYILPPEIRVETNKDLVPLSSVHVPEMLDLTQLVLPGFFQRRSLEMGSYFGIFDKDRLVAMTGERIFPKPFKEITAVCTHPDYQGRSYASKLVMHVAALMRSEGNIPFLHVGVENMRARELYQRLGFQVRGETQIFGLRRVRL